MKYSIYNIMIAPTSKRITILFFLIAIGNISASSKRIAHDGGVGKIENAFNHLFHALPVNRTISGKIIDSALGKPMAGAMVVVKGTQTSYITSDDGFYHLSFTNEMLSGKKLVLIVSCPGYNQNELSVSVLKNRDTHLDMKMSSGLIQCFTITSNAPKKKRH